MNCPICNAKLELSKTKKSFPWVMPGGATIPLTVYICSSPYYHGYFIINPETGVLISVHI